MIPYKSYLRTEKTLQISEKHELIDWDYSKFKIANLNLSYCKASEKLGEDFLFLLDFYKTKNHAEFVGNNPTVKSFKKMSFEFFDLNDNKFSLHFINESEIILYVYQKNINSEYIQTHTQTFKSFKELIDFRPIKEVLKKKSIISFLTDKIKG